MAAVMSSTTQDNRSVLRQRLSALVESGRNLSDIADLAGVSRPSVSRFLNEESYGSPQVIRKIEHAVAILDGTAPVPQVEVTSDGFVKTTDAREVWGICDLALQNRRLGVIVAPPGTGKTFALERYVSQVPEAVYVRANPNMSAAGLCIRIGQQLGLDLRNGQSLDYMVDQIVARLKEEPRLLIIDEADYLTSKISMRRMELLRTIYDEARCGMVLCGMPRLQIALTTGLGMKDNLSQFYSRVAVMRRLAGWSDDEIRAACRDYQIDSDAWPGVFRVARDAERGGMRRVDNLLRNAALVADGARITARHLREVAAELELTYQG
ncbi:MAG: AAA family ATPase [Bacillota bacterium]